MIKSSVLKLIKKFSFILMIVLLVNIFHNEVYASKVIEPKNSYDAYYYRQDVNLEDFIPKNATASNSRKGFLFTGSPDEIFELGASHIAINVTITGRSHTYINFIRGLKKHGVKITLILANDEPPIGLTTMGAPKDYQNPYLYMIDFNNGVNGERQREQFNQILEDFYDCVDNWIIGNEINCQLYNYYGPSDIDTYTKIYLDTFLQIYTSIKNKNKNANVYMSFDQGWDVPHYRKDNTSAKDIDRLYRYNMKDQLQIINSYLDKRIEWGVAIHPYPTPVDDAKFWDDEYAGFDPNAVKEKDRPYYLTAKNFEIVFDYLNNPIFKDANGNNRRVIMSEIAISSMQGEELQAAGLYYLWKKVEKYTNIECFLYNAQTDVNDGLHFGLTSDKGRRRLAWVCFRDMDDVNKRKWCDDLLDRILEENDYKEVDSVLTRIHGDNDNLLLVENFYKEYIDVYKNAGKSVLKEQLLAVKKKYMTASLIDFLAIKEMEENLDKVIVANDGNNFIENAIYKYTEVDDEVEVSVVIANDIFKEVRDIKVHIGTYDGVRLMDDMKSIRVEYE